MKKPASILEKVQNKISITRGNAGKAHVHLAEAISSTPDWVQNILLNDDIAISTAADSYLIALARAAAKGKKGNYSNLNRTLDFYHYTALDTLWHELAHRADFLLAHYRYLPTEHCGPASVNTDEWTKAVNDLVSKKGTRNPIYRHLTKEKYEQREYRQEAFAELMMRYIQLYRENPKSASDHLQAEQPMLWPIFEKIFLPKLKEFGDDIAVPLDDYIQNGKWSIESKTELRYGRDPFECLVLDISDISLSRRLWFGTKLDALDNRASINDRTVESGKLFIKRDRAAVLEQKLIETGKLSSIHESEIPQRADGNKWGDLLHEALDSNLGR